MSVKGNPHFLGIWAGALIIAALLLGPLSVFTFGAVSFAGLLILWLRENRERASSAIDVVNGLMLAACVLWFIINIVVELSRDSSAQILLLAVAFIFPPLMTHLFYLTARESMENTGPWRIAVVGVYVAGHISAALLFATFYQLIVWTDRIPWPLVFMILLSLQFVAAGVISILALTYGAKGRVKQARREARRVNLAMLLGTVLMFLIVILGALTSGEFFERVGSVLSLVSRSLPLLFLFVNSYYESRFSFFDVFVKKATLFFILLAGLLAYFEIAMVFVEGVDLESWLRPWIYSLTLAPLVMAVPTLYRFLEGWLDHHWLGRVFSPVDAVKTFLEGVKGATTVQALVGSAERQLSVLFGSEVQVGLKGELDADFAIVQRIPIHGETESEGEIRMGMRPNDTPYFRTDMTLLSALADVFSYLLLNVRLQEKKQEQEKREQELVLDVSRSQLKALRAQVNPHFLFNALNIIASLVHRDPDRAEATVEQLADVFRYTLSRSDQEWVRVEDEIEFLKSYLTIEQARFGDRLVTVIDVGPETLEMPIPSMAIQTLLENAFKHGISGLRGVGRVEVRVKRERDELLVQVSDNGPGINAVSPPARNRSGYGLKNLRSRLAGYFSGAASLELSRDEDAGRTVATLRMPVSRMQGERRRAL